MTPEERRLRAQIAAHTLHSTIEDPAAHTAPARRAFEQRFYRGLDHLPPGTRERIAGHRRAAYYKRLALAGVRARRRA